MPMMPNGRYSAPHQQLNLQVCGAFSPTVPSAPYIMSIALQRSVIDSKQQDQGLIFQQTEMAEKKGIEALTTI